MNENNKNIELEIFKTGNYGQKGNYSESDLRQIAEDYNPLLHEAPVTLDHSQTGPALGWIESLKNAGEKLVAKIKNIQPELVSLIKSGGYKKRSVELYKKFRETGRPYLRALTFLGAQVPEVKGLQDPLFNDSNDDIIDLSSADEPAVNENNLPSALFEENMTAMSELISKNKLAEEEIANLKSKLRKTEISSFIESMKKLGKITPAMEAEGLADFIFSIDSLPELSFGEGSSVSTPADWFLSFLNKLPPMVIFAETAPEKTVGPLSPNPFFADTLNQRVKPESLNIHNKAISFMETNPGTLYADAVLSVSKE